ncbi:MAG: hypothetical protein HGA37_12745 [Lentimicrobium sp.]|nr:hypothetical protein [Lentimicrobium sp.]
MAKKNILITIIFILVAFIVAASVPLFIWLISDLADRKLIYNHLLNNISGYSFLAFCVPLSWLMVVLMKKIRERFEDKGLSSTSYYSGPKSFTSREVFGDQVYELANFRKFRIFHVLGLPVTIGILVAVYLSLTSNQPNLFVLLTGILFSATFYILLNRKNLYCFINENTIRSKFSSKSYNLDDKIKNIKFALSSSDVLAGLLLLTAYLLIIFDFVFLIIYQVQNTELPVFLFYIFYFSVFANFYLLIFYLVNDSAFKE